MICENRKQACKILATKFDQFNHRFDILGYPEDQNGMVPSFMQWIDYLKTTGLYNSVFDLCYTMEVKDAYYPVECTDVEEIVINYFADLHNFDTNNVFGFVSNNTTDSSLHSVFIGDTLLYTRHKQRPKMYFTQNTHYSASIISYLLKIPHIIVDHEEDGKMNIDDLQVKLNANPEPAIIFATTGTTFHGAIDPLDKIAEIAKKRGTGYIHNDAAFFGGYLPYVAKDKIWVSQKDMGFQSLAVSFHKFHGYHAPAGLFLIEKDIFDEFKETFNQQYDSTYLGTSPGLIWCQRDPIKPAELCFYTFCETRQLIEQRVQQMFEKKNWFMEQLKQTKLPFTTTSDSSATLIFPNLYPDLAKKYILETFHDNAHIQILPGISEEKLDQFIQDIKQKEAK